MLNDAKASHNEVHAFWSEPGRLFQLALHTVFYSVFNSVFTVMLMRAAFPFMSMPAHAHSAVLTPSPTLLSYCCALLSASRITVNTLFEMASINCFFR